MKNQKTKNAGRWLAVLSLAALFTGCTTTLPDGTKVPDKAKTEKVKAVVEGISTMVLRRALMTHSNDANNIAIYAGSVGSVFCDMQATKKFSPETLEAGLAAHVLPLFKDEQARLWVADFRDALKLVYRQFWADRFNAELNPDAWPAAVADIFCNSIDQALRDSGRPGIKVRVGALPLMAPTDEASRVALRKALEQGR